MTDRECKYWALRKWYWIRDNCHKNEGFVDNENYVAKAIPQLLEFHAQCSYCEEHRIIRKNKCRECPIFKIDRSCLFTSSTHGEWAIHRNKKSAQKMIDLIMKIDVTK
jgi:hypothetical protein